MIFFHGPILLGNSDGIRRNLRYGLYRVGVCFSKDRLFQRIIPRDLTDEIVEERLIFLCQRLLWSPAIVVEFMDYSEP